LLLLALVQTPLGASPLGLLDQPQTFPWTAGLTPVAQEEEGGLDPGQFRLKTHVLWLNTYRQYGLGADMEQEVDMEAGLLSVSGAWSFARGWELRGHGEGWLVGGGILDPLIAGFHNLVGVPNQGRNDVPNDRYRDYLKGAFDDTQPGAGLTQLSGGVRAFAGPWSWTAWVKVPVPAHTGWGWTSQWGTGTGVGWGDRWPVGEWGLSLRAGASAAALAIGEDDRFPDQTGWLTGQWGSYVGVEWTRGPRLLVQGSWTAVPRGGAGYLPQGAGLLTMGLQLPWTEQWTFEASWTEEFLTWATNETGFGAGFVWIP
jgi:hypothetical protein